MPTAKWPTAPAATCTPPGSSSRTRASAALSRPSRPPSRTDPAPVPGGGRRLANALLQPARLDVLRQLAEPRSCPQVAAALGLTTSRVHYHVKVLEKAGLVERVAERRVRAVVEGVYQAAARSYWLSAGLVGRLGG